MKKFIIVTTALSIFTIFLFHPKQELSVGINTGNQQKCSVENYILNNIPDTPVDSKFIPVAIYRMSDKTLAGVGSLFKNGDEIQIVTAEHLFGYQYGNDSYVYRSLLNRNDTELYCVEKVKHTGKELSGETADIITLKTGSLTNLKGFSIHGNINFRMNVSYEETDGSLVSLASGKKVQIIGSAKSTGVGDNNVQYVVIDYASKRGESGTGFIDENDNLYVLKGWISILNNTKQASVVYGPLKF